MIGRSLGVVAAALGAVFLCLSPASAQVIAADIVSSCGAVTYAAPSAGGNGHITMDTTGRLCNNNAAIPSSAAGVGIAPVVSTAAESNHVLKASPGNLYSLTTTIGATSGYLMLFDATSLPGNGAVTPKFCRPVVSNGTNGGLSLAWPVPLVFATGITAGFSTTGCFSLTASATGNFFGQVQ